MRMNRLLHRLHNTVHVSVYCRFLQVLRLTPYSAVRYSHQQDWTGSRTERKRW